MIILFSILGGFLYRLRGGLWEWFPRTIARVLFASPLVFIIDSNTENLIYFVILSAFLWLGVVTGHGAYMDLGRSNNPDDEFIRPFVDLFFGKDDKPSFWRDFFGLSITGLLIGFPIAIATLNPIPAIGGSSKGIAYWIGTKLEGKVSLPRVKGWTEWGEVFFGMFVYFSAYFVI